MAGDPPVFTKRLGPWVVLSRAVEGRELSGVVFEGTRDVWDPFIGDAVDLPFCD